MVGKEKKTKYKFKQTLYIKYYHLSATNSIKVSI